MQIKVIDVEVEKVQKGKNSYEVAEVLYDQGGQKRSFKVISFASPAVFKTISQATKGDEFDVEVTKNDAGFNQWVSCTPSDGSGSASHSVPSRSSSGTGSTAAPARTSTYETPEERANRQRLIVRQSSLTAALGILSPGTKEPLDVQVVKALAEELTDWVFEKPDLFAQSNDLEE